MTVDLSNYKHPSMRNRPSDGSYFTESSFVLSPEDWKHIGSPERIDMLTGTDNAERLVVKAGRQRTLTSRHAVTNIVTAIQHVFASQPIDVEQTSTTDGEPVLLITLADHA